MEQMEERGTAPAGAAASTKKIWLRRAGRIAFRFLLPIPRWKTMRSLVGLDSVAITALASRGFGRIAFSRGVEKRKSRPMHRVGMDERRAIQRQSWLMFYVHAFAFVLVGAHLVLGDFSGAVGAVNFAMYVSFCGLFGMLCWRASVSNHQVRTGRAITPQAFWRLSPKEWLPKLP